MSSAIHLLYVFLGGVSTRKKVRGCLQAGLDRPKCMQAWGKKRLMTNGFKEAAFVIQYCVTLLGDWLSPGQSSAIVTCLLVDMAFWATHF